MTELRCCCRRQADTQVFEKRGRQREGEMADKRTWMSTSFSSQLTEQSGPSAKHRYEGPRGCGDWEKESIGVAYTPPPLL